MKRSRFLIFIPTFNECDDVAGMVGVLFALGLNEGILSIDDNSPDGRGEILDRLAAKLPRLSVLHRSGKQGIGSAYQDRPGLRARLRS